MEITATDRVLASQRVTWGPSFGETPGMDFDALDSSYHWTWYDQAEPGVSNWVLIANPSTISGVYYKVFVAGDDKTGCAWLDAGDKAAPTFAGLRGGPVEVRAYADSGCTTEAPAPGVLASQRVLWKGYFNEVLGTVLD